MPPAGLEPATY